MEIVPEAILEAATREREIVEALAPHDPLQRAWLMYVTVLEGVSLVYLEVVKEVVAGE